MTQYTPKIDDVSRIVFSAYGTLQPETDEDRAVNEALENQLRNWFAADERQLSDAANYCINRFVVAELDYTTEGDRGLGRMTDYWARFGGKYRHIISKLDTESTEALHRAFSDALCCGYLFSEYLIECAAGALVPRDEFPDGSEGVFERWVPTIYDKSGPPAFDAEFAQDNGQAYYDIKGLWGHATGDVIHSLFERHNIPVDKYAQTLIRQYFDAGVMLRITEMNRVSDAEHYDTVTSGGYSAATNTSTQKTGGTGCLVLIALASLTFTVGAIVLA